MDTGTSPAVILEGADQSDEDVIRQVLAGKTALFELLMRRYNERLYRAARAIVRDEQEAEDVMQQAYVNAFTHLRQFKGSAQFSTWLTRIAINEALARAVVDAGTRRLKTTSRTWSHSCQATQHRIPSVRRSQASFEVSWNGRSMHCPTACAKYSCSERLKG